MKEMSTRANYEQYLCKRAKWTKSWTM